MTLTGDQLRPFLFGAAGYDIEDGALCPYKCSKSLLEGWGRHEPWLREMAEYTSGIRLEFCTYASRVCFTVEGGAFDLLADGELVCHQEVSGAPEEISAELPDKGVPEPSDQDNYDKMTRVTLVFPNLKRGKIRSLTLPEDGLLRRPRFDENFLFLGDSITQGFEGTFPSLSYAQRVSRFYNADCVIQGVGGGFFHPDLFEAPAGFDPHRVFIAFGTNDVTWSRTPEQIRQWACGYLDRVKEAYGHKKVYCILPIWRGDARFPLFEGEFRWWIPFLRAEEEARGFTVIDGMSLVPHSPAFFAPDRLHPNDLGFSLYAENLIKAMETAD